MIRTLILIPFSVSPEKAHAVNFSGDELYFTGNEDRVITWSPEQLVPDLLPADSVKVDISIYTQKYIRSDGSFEWEMHHELVNNVDNDGEEVVNLPLVEISCRYPVYLGREFSAGFGICPIVFRVSVSASSSSVLPSSIGLWSGVAFIESSSIRNKELTFRKQCLAWADAEKANTARLRQLRSCPPNQLVASFDIELEREDRFSILSSTTYEEQYMNYFHPDTIDVCYRQNS